jgi:membrane protease YdiL (CAAX protease family)
LKASATRQLAAFFILACAFTWALLPFAGRSVAAGLVGLWGPAVAAALVASVAGVDAWRDLRTRILRWRVPVRWYLVALLLPILVSGFRTAVESIAGAAGPVEFQPVSALGLIVFVLVAGEEIGWRGFALPRLLARFGPWMGSAVLGVGWAAWHLPLFFMASMPQYGTPFASYVLYLIGLSVVLTWLAMKTGGSVIIATLFHGAVNTFGLVNTGASAAVRGWGNALAYGTAALVIGLIAWRVRGAPEGRR